MSSDEIAKWRGKITEALAGANRRLASIEGWDDRIRKTEISSVIMNREMGELKDGFSDIKDDMKSLHKLINKKVAAPMTGRDRSYLYGSLVGVTGSIIIALIALYQALHLQYLASLV